MPFSPSPRRADRSIAGNRCCEDLSVLRSAEGAKPPVIAPTAQGASWLYSSVTRLRDNLMKAGGLSPMAPSVTRAAIARSERCHRLLACRLIAVRCATDIAVVPAHPVSMSK